MMIQNAALDDDLSIYINQDELNKFPSESRPLDSEPLTNLDCLTINGDSDSLSLNDNDQNAAGLESAWPGVYIDQHQFVSKQFYTFNKLSHELMIDCILAKRNATAEEIRNVTPVSMLDSWRSTWNDRSEETGFATAWKRIQEKLDVHVDRMNGNKFLCFKSNLNRFIPYFEQWLDIVIKFHCEGDSRHLSIKRTIERIRTMWTTNEKFYGVPESFIRVCVNMCPMCCDSSSGLAPVSKRRKVEYRETIDVPVKEVEKTLQELAEKYKAVLCVKQKYIRRSPFVAEVKDYVCDRAGEPMLSNMKDSTKSKKCGCNFRIRVIVPVVECNEEGKAFVCQDEGVAQFKLYAVHSGHETGELDENASIKDTVIGNGDGLLMDQNVGNGAGEEEEESSGIMATDFENLQHSLSSCLKELKSEAELIEGNLGKLPSELLGSATQAAFEALSALRSWKEHGSKQHLDDVLVGGAGSEEWVHDQMISGDIKPAELIEDNGHSFGRTLGSSASRGQVRTDCRDMRDKSLSHALADNL
ncbi:LOB domain-containing protein 31-like [Heracleum sosnowskyi]|uniref:LOB domain-containing protein 31-like n=1 Tax=Heracleum sosnowskyi TaxID=360622 RepID=A0AAD8HZE6_9APIA|nr:LOB domain-containing protein 31-like [Heracleum sosnowskyi]